MRHDEAQAPFAYLARDASGRKLIDGIDDDAAHALVDLWPMLARAKQVPPEGAWRVWLLLAGRGFGKTRSGAEWVRARIEDGLARRVALVAPTAADARDVMIEGDSGLVAIGAGGLRAAVGAVAPAPRLAQRRDRDRVLGRGAASACAGRSTTPRGATSSPRGPTRRRGTI